MPEIPDQSAPDSEDEARLAGRLRDVLMQGAPAVDDATRARLAQARSAAIARAARPRAGLILRQSPSRTWLWPAGALAASVVVAALLVFPRAPAPTPDAAGDLELLVLAEDLDLIENFEFYAWLETTQAGR